MSRIALLFHATVNLFNPIENAWSCTIWIILVASLLRKSQRERWQDFVTILGYVGYCGVAIQLQTLLIWYIPHTLDAAFLRADHALGFDPIHFAAAFAPHKYLMLTLNCVYYVLPIAGAIGWVVEQNPLLRESIGIGGLGCWIGFALLPAVGPKPYFANMRFAPRNCMPSMHLTWALLAAVNARRMWLRSLLWVFAALTALSTIVLGEHYLIDLIAAVFYTLAVQWVTVRISSRSRTWAEVAAA
jgi:membrane-associated phospholipid phosphatase